MQTPPKCFACESLVVKSFRTYPQWYKHVDPKTGYFTWVIICGPCLRRNWRSTEREEDDEDRRHDHGTLSTEYNSKVIQDIKRTAFRKDRRCAWEAEDISRYGKVWDSSEDELKGASVEGRSGASKSAKDDDVGMEDDDAQPKKVTWAFGI